jgi:transposase
MVERLSAFLVELAAAPLDETFGFAIRYQRLEKGTFRFPEGKPSPGQSSWFPAGVEIRAADLAMLLDGVDLESVRRRRRYTRPAAA